MARLDDEERFTLHDGRQGVLPLPKTHVELEKDGAARVEAEEELAAFRRTFEQSRQIFDSKAKELGLKKFAEGFPVLSIYVREDHSGENVPNTFWSPWVSEENQAELVKHEIKFPIESQEQLVRAVNSMHILYEGIYGAIRANRSGSNGFMEFVHKSWGMRNLDSRLDRE